jgi:hypothetical protein
VDDQGYAGFVVPYIELIKTITQSINHNTDTCVSWNTIIRQKRFVKPITYDAGNAIIIPIRGLYLINYTILWSTTGTSSDQYSKTCYIHTSNGGRYGQYSLPDSWLDSYMSGSTTISFEAGDVFMIYANQLNWTNSDPHNIIGNTGLTGGIRLTCSYVGAFVEILSNPESINI